MKNFRNLFFLYLIFNVSSSFAQVSDSAIIRHIYNFNLSSSDCYKNLDYLCNQIGPRLSGSENAAKAVEYTKTKLESYGYDKVYLQEVMVPKWVRGEKEKAEIRSNNKKTNVAICALGGSIKTPEKGIEAEVIEVQNFEELAKLGKDKIQGKIVFFNRPMDPKHIETFNAYGGAVNQRGAGAIEAAKYGAVASIIRSMNLRIDRFPHTGAMRYQNGINKIPSAAISTYDANLLSQALKGNTKLKFWFKMSCDTFPDIKSYNVIAEITGTENPNKYIVVGGHLDSWDLAQGAHDDGAGCMQSMEVLNTFKKLNIKPKNTIRVVLFMNEENGLRGGQAYAKEVANKNEFHIAALESDEGGFTPRGFDIDASPNVVNKIKSWQYLFQEYGVYDLRKGGGGSDIGPLKKQGVTLLSLRPDSQRYFDIHHAATDTFDSINKRELELGAASISSLIYLIDKYGL